MAYKQKDLIIGCSDGYDWEQIKYWANSIDMSGFNGHKALVVFNCNKPTLDKLTSKNFTVVSLEMDAEGNAVHTKRNPRIPVHVERFFHIWHVLSELDQPSIPQYVITTDVKDVVFQTNPSEFVRDQLETTKESLIVGSEGLRYMDEEWGKTNLLQTFGPFFYEKYKECPIFNVGTVAGTYEAVKDLSLMIFQMSLNRPIPIVDQAVFNFLLWQQPYYQTTRFCRGDFPWACQAGTLIDPSKIEGFRKNLLCQEPYWNDEDSCIYTGRRKDVPLGAAEYRDKYCIFHQWDRTQYKDKVMQKYG